MPITIELRNGHEIWKKVDGEWVEIRIGSGEYNHYWKELSKIEQGDTTAGERITPRQESELTPIYQEVIDDQKEKGHKPELLGPHHIIDLLEGNDDE